MLQTDEGTGYRTLLDMSKDRQRSYFAQVGFGLLGMDRHRSRQGFTTAYDFLRERQFDVPEGWTSMYCLAEGWLVKSKSAGWMLYDLCTETTTLPGGIEHGDRLVQVTPRGKLIVCNLPTPQSGDRPAGGCLFRVDIRRGSRQALEIPGISCPKYLAA